jgi:hypothetical protein
MAVASSICEECGHQAGGYALCDECEFLLEQLEEQARKKKEKQDREQETQDLHHQ